MTYFDQLRASVHAIARSIRANAIRSEVDVHATLQDTDAEPGALRAPSAPAPEQMPTTVPPLPGEGWVRPLSVPHTKESSEGENNSQWDPSRITDIGEGAIRLVAADVAGVIHSGGWHANAKISKGRWGWQGRATRLVTGIVPAFFLYGNQGAAGNWGLRGEVDFEWVYRGGKWVVQLNIHLPDSTGRRHTLETVTGGAPVFDFDPLQVHIYEIEWTATACRWFIDGKQIHEVLRSMFPADAQWDEDRHFVMLAGLYRHGPWAGVYTGEGLPAAMELYAIRFPG